jgi:alkanesulfonate monooxygenase SsuD/methylene tetrahydromethanopterin reductase-like flavin-dependent oxidoreductase (luciferase family)
MQFGLFNLMGLAERGGAAASGMLRATREMVRLAEAVGFDAAWFAEHHFSNFSVCPSPLLMTAHCAAVTERIRLGPAVLVLPFYDPRRLVEELAFVDAASGGRLTIGFGTGHQPHEFEAMGVPLDERYERTCAAWDAIESGLSSGRLALNGAGPHGTPLPPTEMAIRPAQPGRPPMFVASGDPRILARAAQRGVTPFISQGFRTAEAALAMRGGVEAAFREAGVAADPAPLAVQRYAFVTRDRNDAREAAARMLDFARNAIGLRRAGMTRGGAFLTPEPFEGEPTLDWLLDHAPFGPPEHVAAILARDAALLRPVHMTVYTGFAGLDPRRVLRSIELFGTEVIPAVRQASAT